ncbi:MAG: exonuclease domain-containing protein [Verrucomicrobiota bacterium]
MRALDAKFIVIDFETTGTVQNLPSEPWQIGYVCVEDGSIDPQKSFMSHLKIGNRPFHPRAPGNYHQLRDQLEMSPTLTSLWPQLSPTLGNLPLAAHNISVERNILTQYIPLHQLGPWIDTLQLARKALPNLKSYALEDLSQALELTSDLKKLCPELAPHDALYDASASALLLLFILKQDGWQDCSLEYLSQLSTRNSSNG